MDVQPTFEKPAPKSRFPTGLIVIVAIVILIGIAMIPAIWASQAAARRMEAINHVKQIGLALHNYHDVSASFPPPVTYNAEREPAYSWRLAVVPYLEASSLFNDYDRSARWDDPKNAALCNFPLSVFERRGAQNQKQFATNFVFVTGPGTLFPPEGPASFGDVKDGRHQTIMVVEIDNSDILWYEPRDLEIDKMSFRISDPDRSKPCIGNRRRPGAIVGMVDLSVHYLPADTPPEVLKAMLTIAGGEDVKLPPP